MPQTKRIHPWLLLLSAFILVGGIAWGLKDGPLALADAVGYAICHQITVRTYVFGDLVMPLCARCSGQYLGVVAGLVVALLRGKLRASNLPPRKIILAFVIFLVVWAFDGINSYVYLVTQQIFIYMPRNVLRLTTGLLQGIAVSMLFIPLFNQIFWREPDPSPILTGWRDLGYVLGGAALLGMAVHSRWLPLFYPLAFLSTAGAFLLLSLVGMVLVVQVLGSDNMAESWRDFFLFLLFGMAFAILLIAGMDALRAGIGIDFG